MSGIVYAITSQLKQDQERGALRLREMEKSWAAQLRRSNEQITRMYHEQQSETRRKT